jgi:hypothetical protein
VEVANKERPPPLPKSGTTHDLSVEDLLFGITIALVDVKDELPVTSVTRVSTTIFLVKPSRQLMWGR